MDLIQLATSDEALWYYWLPCVLTWVMLLIEIPLGTDAIKDSGYVVIMMLVSFVPFLNILILFVRVFGKLCMEMLTAFLCIFFH